MFLDSILDGTHDLNAVNAEAAAAAEDYEPTEEEEEIDKDFEKSLVEYSVIWITSALYPYDKIMIT